VVVFFVSLEKVLHKAWRS